MHTEFLNNIHGAPQDIPLNEWIHPESITQPGQLILGPPSGMPNNSGPGLTYVEAPHGWPIDGTSALIMSPSKYHAFESCLNGLEKVYSSVIGDGRKLFMSVPGETNIDVHPLFGNNSFYS